MKATIYHLVFCHTCHKRVKKADIYTRWEGSVYCEGCFDKYIEMIEPREWNK